MSSGSVKLANTSLCLTHKSQYLCVQVQTQVMVESNSASLLGRDQQILVILWSEVFV